MVIEKFSDSLPEYNDNIENPALQDSFKSLERIVGSKLKMLDWGNGRIAVPLDVEVDLPSLGNVESLDIRKTESIILVFDLINYPSASPMVFTDRLDFPKNNLAHLYVAANNRPPAFCYVRGNRDEWYANKRIEDLVVRISNWLRDAAAGELTDDGEQFDPLRLEGYSGTIIYDYDTILDIIINNKPFPYFRMVAIALFEGAKESNKNTFKFVKLLTSENALDTIKEVNEERKKSKDDFSQKIYQYGYIVWGEESSISNYYCVNLPKNWYKFIEFSEMYGIDHNELGNFVEEYPNINEPARYPVIVAIRRPKQLIGYSSSIEFINFCFKIDSDEVKDEKIINKISIDFYSHNQPLTQSQAAQISNFQIKSNFRTIIFGCGALGSKIIMHMSRAGYTDLSLVDPDSLSPHNLVRHALYSEDEGANKALALTNKIKKMYPFQNVIALGIEDKQVINEKVFIGMHDWVLDFTASPAFFTKLSTIESLTEKNVVSAMISDFGNLGILYKEGNNRNPRIDDLQAHLYGLSLRNANIREWLQREKLANSNNNITVRVGVGCNSETTILSDDKISSHAAYFSGVIKREMSNNSADGKINLCRINDETSYDIGTETINVSPVHIFEAINDTTWSIRVQDEVYKKILKEFSIGGESETGGVFIGYCNHKIKTIYVVDSILAPKDSEANSIHFMRGIDGLPEEIECAIKSSGGQIGYIGEWHTHPKGPNALSDQDMESVSKHKSEFEKLNPPLPVFLTIITPHGLFPFVY